MAGKPVKPIKKTSARSGKNGRKPTKQKPKALLRLPGRAQTTPRKAPAGKNPRPSRSTQAPIIQKPTRPALSLDRKLDITGVILILVGLLTFLSLLSPISDSPTWSKVSLIGQILGWGMYLFPFALIVTGLWLVLRNFERIPQLAIERVLGFALLFLNLLAVFHFLQAIISKSGQDAFEVALAGQGGGYLGALIFVALQAVLGIGGAGIALLAWFVIALTLVLDMPVVGLVRWIPPLIVRLQDWWIERREARRAGSSAIAPALSRLPADAISSQSSPSTPVGTPSAAGSTPDGALPPHSETPTWILPPPAEILDPGNEVEYDDEADRQRAQLIEETLASFDAPARVVEINRGPTVTQFGVEPDFIDGRGGRTRVRVGKIAALEDDLALALSAKTIRIEAPVPGKSYVGIEVPNDEIAHVALRDLVESEAFKRLRSPLRFALGLNVSGNAVAADLAAMPHLLIAGATGSGKSVCVNALICCLLLHNTPDDLRLIMVDPKRVELTSYNGIPHLLVPVVVELEKVITVLQRVTREMDMRYRKLAEAGVRNIYDYNQRAATLGQPKLFHLIVFIDELADLMMLSPEETEHTITRLAQLARATGIHLVIATQRPSVNVVTGLIKANFPARIAFAVASQVDSRVILDQNGAERLLGRGDMLFQAPDAAAPVRIQGVFISDNEILRLVTYWQGLAGSTTSSSPASDGAVDQLPASIPLKQLPLWEMEAESGDPLYNEAIDLSRRQGRSSISMLQRRLRIGYTRAARLVETMEQKGIVGPPDPTTGTREILDYGPAGPPVEEQGE